MNSGRYFWWGSPPGGTHIPLARQQNDKNKGKEIITINANGDIRTETIMTVNSAKRAHRALSELTTNGRYVAQQVRNGFTVYARMTENGTEELSVIKENMRFYRIVKEVK